MQILPKNVEKLINELSSLPGIGPKMAQRLTLYLLKVPKEELKDLGDAFTGLKDGIRLCLECANWSEAEICRVCSNSARDKKTVMIVEDPLDVVALERAGFMGRYHILHGLLSPMDGIGPDDLMIKPLLTNIRINEVEEVILATNPSVEGEATAMYLKKILEPSGVKTTRLAHGLPIGGEIEYADEGTLGSALNGRTSY